MNYTVWYNNINSVTDSKSFQSDTCASATGAAPTEVGNTPESEEARNIENPKISHTSAIDSTITFCKRNI